MNSDGQEEFDRLRQQQAAFLRAAAHGLRTPLQSLQGFAELLEPGLPAAQIEHYVNFIKRDTTQLAAVVDDLCLRHELEQGSLTLFPTAIDVESLLAEVARTFESRIPDCLVEWEYSGEIPPVYADPDRLTHILWTLLRNAERCRLRPEQLSLVSVFVQPRPETHRVVFRVDDEGVRIPIEDSARIFGVLADAPTPRRWPRMGIGLGLYVAREVARQMGGDLGLLQRVPASGRQHGNTFELSLPSFQGQVVHD